MRVLIPALVLAACNGGTPTDTDTDTDPVDPFTRFISPTVEIGGCATDCFTPGPDHAGTSWLTQTVDATRAGAETVAGSVIDFQQQLPVEAATVALWLDDAVVGAPDATAQGDASGAVSLQAPTCTPHTYRLTTDPVAVETQTTFKAHHVVQPGDGGPATSDYISVSDTTYRLIPTILGVAVDPGLAVIAGTTYGCGRDAGLPSDVDDEKLTGAQVVVYDAEGNIPETLSVHYFTQRFPDRAQPHTSADGLWVAINVPPGRLRAEAYGLVGGELTLLGATVLDSAAGSINIANIFTGYGDGVKVPDACVAPVE